MLRSRLSELFPRPILPFPVYGLGKPRTPHDLKQNIVIYHLSLLRRNFPSQIDFFIIILAVNTFGKLLSGEIFVSSLYFLQEISFLLQTYHLSLITGNFSFIGTLLSDQIDSKYFLSNGRVVRSLYLFCSLSEKCLFSRKHITCHLLQEIFLS